MFKLILIIDCDICGESFDRVALSTDRDPTAWQYLTADLEMRAESRGWNLHRAEYRCYDCCDSEVICCAQRAADEGISS